MHSARVIYYAIYTQRVFRKGLFITQYIRSVHSERRRGERGNIYYPFKKHYQIENERYINE